MRSPSLKIPRSILGYMAPGLMTGIIGAAGGVGGFYLPVALGIAKEQTGSYHWGFGIFAGLSGTALLLVLTLSPYWLHWSRPAHSPQPVGHPQQINQPNPATD